jgi:hypothetical protein
MTFVFFRDHGSKQAIMSISKFVKLNVGFLCVYKTVARELHSVTGACTYNCA